MTLRNSAILLIHDRLNNHTGDNYDGRQTHRRTDEGPEGWFRGQANQTGSPVPVPERRRGHRGKRPQDPFHVPFHQGEGYYQIRQGDGHPGQVD